MNDAKDTKKENDEIPPKIVLESNINSMKHSFAISLRSSVISARSKESYRTADG